VKRVPIRPKRPGTRRGQPTPAEVARVRHEAYERSGGRCELRIACDGVWLPEFGEVLYRWHLVHLTGKRNNGTHLENTCGGCNRCHIGFVHQGKVGRLPATYAELEQRREERRTQQ
jgi:hypothetical protein